MSVSGSAIIASYYAWNTSTGTVVTGDKANHTLNTVVDGTKASLAAGTSGANITDQGGGLYTISVGGTANTGTMGQIEGTSSTSNVILIGVAWNNLPATPYSGTPPTAAQVATAIFQDLTSSSDFTTSGSIGKLLAAIVNQTGDSYPIVSSGTYGLNALLTVLNTLATSSQLQLASGTVAASPAPTTTTFSPVSPFVGNIPAAGWLFINGVQVPYTFAANVFTFPATAGITAGNAWSLDRASTMAQVGAIATAVGSGTAGQPLGLPLTDADGNVAANLEAIKGTALGAETNGAGSMAGAFTLSLDQANGQLGAAQVPVNECVDVVALQQILGGTYPIRLKVSGGTQDGKIQPYYASFAESAALVSNTPIYNASDNGIIYLNSDGHWLWGPYAATPVPADAYATSVASNSNPVGAWTSGTLGNFTMLDGGIASDAAAALAIAFPNAPNVGTSQLAASQPNLAASGVAQAKQLPIQSAGVVLASPAPTYATGVATFAATLTPTIPALQEQALIQWGAGAANSGQCQVAAISGAVITVNASALPVAGDGFTVPNILSSIPPTIIENITSGTTIINSR